MQVLPIFVYGTLQRGELREKSWPFPPSKIGWATIRAALYDLGPHPAILAGNSVVKGELWHIPEPGLAATLRRLDQIEGFQQPGESDWYRREIVRCSTEAGQSVDAYAYFYACPEQLTEEMRVAPCDQGVCHWRGK